MLFDFTFLLYFSYHFILISSKICLDCTSGDISSNEDSLTGLSFVLFLIILYNQLNVKEEKKPAGYPISFGLILISFESIFFNNLTFLKWGYSAA